MNKAMLTLAAALVLGTGHFAAAADSGTGLGTVLKDAATQAAGQAAQDTLDRSLGNDTRRTRDSDRAREDRRNRTEDRYREGDRYRGDDRGEDRGRSYEHRRDGRGRSDNPGRGHRGDD